MNIQGRAVVLATILIGGLGTLTEPSYARSTCQLGQNSPVKHIVYLQFDNVHLTRDNPNVPSDLEQMPNLLNFLKGKGTLLTNHHTPLISHTAVDILTSLTGVYGDKMGIPIGNTLRYYNPDGTTNGAVSFAYWTDPLDAFSGQTITDTTPQMIDRRGETHPAPWVPFTRAGCDVGAFSVANIELENVGLDVTTVFGASSPEALEAKNKPVKAVADFEGISVHCAKDSALCMKNSRPDRLSQEPGGYTGYNGLFGNASVQPRISPNGPVKDLNGHVIGDGQGNNGFPGFDPSAAQTLGYLATMLEAGVPVVFGYIADAHDNHGAGAEQTYGPGEAPYVAQLARYNDAFGKFFARLQKDGLTPDNTLFVVTADEGDHFAGGSPSPAGCDGVKTPCTYAKKGEVDGDLSQILDTEKRNKTPFSVHSDSAPTFYMTGNPSQTNSITRALERAVGGLTAISPITGKTDILTVAIADQTEQRILHMVTSDPKRTPTFIMFADPDYYLFASGQPSICSPLAGCLVEDPGFAWNHGDIQKEITTTFLGLVGPGIEQAGETGTIFSDHTDIRPTILSLAGLSDDYVHDGRVLFETMANYAVPDAVAGQRALFSNLVVAFKDINAPKGTLGQKTLVASTRALEGDDKTYKIIEPKLRQIAAQRDALTAKMIGMIEKAEFNNQPLDPTAAQSAISAAQHLITSVP